MVTSPNTDNYIIGKGNVYFTPVGGVRTHLGNCPQFEVELTVDKLDHFSSMEGVKKKDKVAVTGQTATVKVTMDEFSPFNMALALMATTSTNSEGEPTGEIFAKTEVVGILELIASNDVGPRIDYFFHSVSFTPSAAISAISEEYGQMEATGEIQAVNGSFGYYTARAVQTETA